MTAKSGGESLLGRSGRQQDEIKDGMTGLSEAARRSLLCVCNGNS